MARRDYEQKMQRLEGDIKGDKNLLHKARWEDKTNAVIQKNMVKNRISQLRNEAAQNLDQRRRALAALLEQEDRQYEQEFMANLETPEQVRQKMAERLFDLKSRREQERKEEVDRRLEQRFRDTADELRKEGSRFYTQQCQLEREQQLMEKRQKMEQQIAEEQLYAKLWELDLKKKEQREMQEKLEKAKTVQERQAVLDWQKQTREAERNHEKNLTQQEREMLKTQWKNEEEREKEAERQLFILNRERNLDLIGHNEVERGLRSQKDMIEKNRDKEMLAAQLQREADLERLENDEKNSRRREVIELQKHYFQEAADKRKEEELLEHLTQIEAGKQQKIRDDQWRKEDNARVNLMKEVYDSRALTVELKKKQKDEKHWLTDYENKKIQEEIERQNREYEEKAIREAALKKVHQGDVLRQIAERDRQQRRELQDKMFEERAAKLAEVAYVKKISDDKNYNQTVLSQLRSQM